MATIFEKIIARELPADIVYEDDHVIAFRDIQPVAPVHVVIATRDPRPLLSQMEPDGDHQRLLMAACEVAKKLGVTSYRVVVNQGEDAGQSVPHLHAHLLAGRSFSWPPG